MITPATLKGHPIHSILVVLPIGAFLASFVSNLVSFWIQDPVWYWLGWYNLWVGFIGGLAAVIPGLIDYFSLPKESAARRTAFIHASLALVMLILFFISLLQHGRSTAPLQPAWKSGFLFSLMGILVMLAVGWLGGSLVYKHQVGVQSPKDVGLEAFGEPRSIANIKGHPIHPMLVPIPFTLFLVSVLFDLLVLLGEDATFWERLAFYELSLSLGGAVLAFFPGMIDAFHVLPMPSGQTVGKHVIAITLFFSALTISLIVRVSGLPFAWWVGFIASLIGLVFLGIGGWFGGDNVYRERIGVEKERVQTRAETLSR
jgi:uncharacterized membrane protein